MKENPRLGIILMLATTFVFAIQDGLSRELAERYNVITVVGIRFWFFALFVMVWGSYQAGGLRQIASTSQPLIQVLRGVLLAAEICVLVVAFTQLGLIESHAVFSCYPLMVVALSGPVLGERVGWRRWLAVFIGFVGVVVVLRPGSDVFSLNALIPLASAALFAIYSLLTRYVAQRDRAETSFFWTGIAGAVAITLVVPFYWVPMAVADAGWMAALCVTGVLGHFLMIKALEVAEATTVQPFAYFHLVFASLIGLWFFAERLDTQIVVGASLIIASGVFSIWRSKARQKSSRPPTDISGAV